MSIDPRTARISSHFGAMEDWRAAAGLGWHTGDDFPGPLYAPILATHPGNIMYNQREGFDSNVGVMTITDHGEFGVLHAHQPETDSANAFTGKAGDVVAEGQPVGKIGMTGWTTGPHTHCMVSVKRLSNGWWDFQRSTGHLVAPQLFLSGGYDDPQRWREALFEPVRWPSSGVVIAVTRRYVTKAEFSRLSGALSVSVSADGKLLPLVVGAPEFVNRAFPPVVQSRTPAIIKVR